MDTVTMFTVYYAGLMSMKFHPRNEEEFSLKDIEYCADVAQRMVDETLNRYGNVVRYTEIIAAHSGG